MRALPAIGAGVLLLIVALVTRAPATLLDARLDALSASRLRLVDAAGTVWNGSGEVRIVPGDSGIRVAWHIEAWPLLLGRLRGGLVTNDASAPAAFDISGGDIDIRNLSLTLPASSLLHAFAGPPALASAGGAVGLRVAALAMRGERLDGDLSLRWSAATLRAPGMPSPLALGDVRFEATGQGNALTGALSNSGGDVDIRGTASASLEGRGRISIAIRTRAGLDPERAKAITSVLAAIGQPDADGGYRFAWP